jgi:hypothetical protein
VGEIFVVSPKKLGTDCFAMFCFFAKKFLLFSDEWYRIPGRVRKP